MFFQRKKTELQLKAEQMPNRVSVQLKSVPIKELMNELARSSQNIYTCAVADEQMPKSEYLNCKFYYSNASEDVYYVIDKIKKDKVRASTPYYKVDYRIMKEIVEKAGRTI